MELHRITVLSLLLYMAYLPYALTGDPIYAKYEERIYIACPTEPNDVYREWYRGEISDSNPGVSTERLYRGKIGKPPVKNDDLRSDFKLYENNYTMSLIVQKEEANNEYFTCVIEGDTKVYDVTQVLMFVQPEVEIVRSPTPDEGVNVTVTCTIPHVYPNITTDKFEMRWDNAGTNEAEFSGTLNNEGTMTYTLVRSKNLTSEDSGVMVECVVTPESTFGEPARANLTLDFGTPPVDPSPSGASYLGATLGGVISGLAAVIIIVTISDSRRM